MKPKIIVARPIFPEVISHLQSYFEVTSNQDDVPWTEQSWTDQLSQQDGAFTFTTDVVNENILKHCTKLKICANMAVGYNNFDVPAMTRYKVVATNTPDVLTQTTADMGFALLMAAARRVAESEHYLRAGQWHQWRFDMFAGVEVHGSTLGILGMGRIGQAIAQRGAFGFGMDVIYHNRSQLSSEQETACKARYVSKQELLEQSDHLVLVLPYSKESHHVIGQKELHQMKPTAVLVNIARGGIVDDVALAQALKEKRIAAAGLDVYEGEPQVSPVLLTIPNVVLTPHIASSTVKTRMAMAVLAADNLISFFTMGKAINPLNPQVLSHQA